MSSQSHAQAFAQFVLEHMTYNTTKTMTSFRKHANLDHSKHLPVQDT
ncbi:hypothetical protein NIES4071_63170 [Calothrix sp. NIES-4071]|nr:hypothetical protein NIES4071_63170 [Calothrix sp. NIES-4071]BAZ60620.1 hypothetical protein NIES4105_63120 [Calothrix sp. NIES-4105]